MPFVQSPLGRFALKCTFLLWAADLCNCCLILPQESWGTLKTKKALNPSLGESEWVARVGQTSLFNRLCRQSRWAVQS